MIAEQPELADLFNTGLEENFKKGNIIFKDQRTGQFVYLVVRGMIKTFSSRQNKLFLEDYFERGELINSYGEIDNNPRVNKAVAIISPTIIRKVPMAAFREVVLANPELCEKVLAYSGIALQRAQNRLFRMAMLSAEQRIYHFLAQHAQNSGEPVGFEYLIKPAMIHRDIAQIAGVGRQTVTTILNELRRDRIIHFNRRYMIVRDLDALRKMAGV